MAGIRVTMLGCGGSQGVPSASGDWGQCDPANPRNRRRRASVLVEVPDEAGDLKRLVIDTSPDFREQMLASGANHIDGVLLTHAHADHLHGIDDLRSFNRSQRTPIHLWAAPETLVEVGARFGYVLSPQDESQTAFYKPAVIPHPVEGPFRAAGIPVVPFAQDHGFSVSHGFRIGAFAYSTDFIRLDAAALKALAGIETWIVDCVRIAPAHATHCHLEQTLRWVAQVNPRRAILTHMDQSCDYDAVTALLPPGVEAGWDGLVIEA
jgi:phosphoribosyl 1,2-cyclic phosphate phosphodiesterase